VDADSKCTWSCTDTVKQPFGISFGRGTHRQGSKPPSCLLAEPAQGQSCGTQLGYRESITAWVLALKQRVFWHLETAFSWWVRDRPRLSAKERYWQILVREWAER